MGGQPLAQRLTLSGEVKEEKPAPRNPQHPKTLESHNERQEVPETLHYGTFTKVLVDVKMN